MIKNIFILFLVLIFNDTLYSAEHSKTTLNSLIISDDDKVHGKQPMPYEEFLMGTSVEYRNFIFEEEENKIDQEFDDLKIEINNFMALLPNNNSLERIGIMKILQNINTIHPIFIENLKKINYIINKANNNVYDYKQLNFLNESIQKNHKKSNLIKEQIKNELALLIIKYKK